uniref:Uncharacterized protein n=1 Tax=Phlebotomus papatasi TaxID=29031 RepID=A0A1B0EY35_PHLPP
MHIVQHGVPRLLILGVEPLKTLLIVII